MDEEFDALDYASGATIPHSGREEKAKENKAAMQEQEEAERRPGDPTTHKHVHGQEGAFRALVRQMSTGFADKLLEFVDFPTLHDSLLELIESSATNPAVSDADGRVVQVAASLWVAIVLYQSELLVPRVYDRLVPERGDSSSFAIVRCANAKVRHCFTRALYQICVHCKAEPSPHAVFLDLLTRNIPTYKVAAAAIWTWGVLLLTRVCVFLLVCNCRITLSNARNNSGCTLNC